MIIVSVFVLSAIATLVRYAIISYWKFNNQYLTAVWLINVCGSFLMGMLLALHQLHAMNGVFSIGLIGSFTTFSTMMTQSSEYHLIKQSIYLLVQILSGFLFFWIGMQFGNLL
ncbi:fluoride efflux transporter FluC [Leuconostoc palmae]|uniref:fluoride efflux transporter FluC n=1 Tax=Leuconostoc palmae TaxID=501487 RepID=UPI001C7D07F2|nr:CrcB family protein [Leuconostoc palmae]